MPAAYIITKINSNSNAISSTEFSNKEDMLHFLNSLTIRKNLQLIDNVTRIDQQDTELFYPNTKIMVQVSITDLNWVDLQHIQDKDQLYRLIKKYQKFFNDLSGSIYPMQYRLVHEFINMG